MKTLVAGWFSFEDGHATGGDLLAAEVACDWLAEAGHVCEIAVAPPFEGGINWRQADPSDYSDVVFVCGPFKNGELEREFLNKFAGCRLTGLNLTMLEPLHDWNPFSILFERDSSATARPDIAFVSDPKPAPVVGVCLVEDYDEALVPAANAAVRKLVSSREAAVVGIDTRLDNNATGLRSPAEIEAMLARMDLVLTTRMHGMVLSLKHGVPVVAIDPEAGGAKVRRQAQTIGWSVVFTADRLPESDLNAAFNYCLTEDARREARRCRTKAEAILHQTRDQFIQALSQPGRPRPSARGRESGSAEAVRIKVAAELIADHISDLGGARNSSAAERPACRTITSSPGESLPAAAAGGPAPSVGRREQARRLARMILPAWVRLP